VLAVSTYELLRLALGGGFLLLSAARFRSWRRRRR
jgi:hypothetical protein